jgi:hypothetical protein
MPRPAPGEINKSQYIRDRAHLKPAQIVVEAAKEGVSITSGMVYTVRANTNRQLATERAKPIPAAPSRPSKAAFIQQYPDLPPEQVVKQLASEGVRATVEYVGVVRQDAARRNLVERLGEELAEAHMGDITTGHQQGLLGDVTEYAAKVALAFRSDGV